MFRIFSIQIQLEEAEKDYREALKNFEEIGPNKTTLKRLVATNLMRKKLKQQLFDESPDA